MPEYDAIVIGAGPAGSTRLAARVAGRVFLYGEPISFGTVWRAAVS